MLRLTVVLAVGMSPYLYLPLSAYFKGVDSWGDQRTVTHTPCDLLDCIYDVVLFWVWV